MRIENITLQSFAIIILFCQIGARTNKVEQQGVLEVLKKSLADHPKDLSAENEVRYKLIIDSSLDESLVRLLFSFGVLEREVTRIHMNSKFRGDSESEKVHMTRALIPYSGKLWQGFEFWGKMPI